jgi:predicted PurR-regulated permease PerM
MSMAFVIFLLIISVSLNAVFVWYIRRLIQEFHNMSNNVENTTEVLDSFIEHLEKLYELETYYGDESLKSLIGHSKQTLEEIKSFETVISSIKESEEEEGEGLDEEGQ